MRLREASHALEDGGIRRQKRSYSFMNYWVISFDRPSVIIGSGILDLEQAKVGIVMGLLDTVIASVLKGTMSDQQSQALPAALAQILGGTSLGGIGGLLAQLQRGGLDRQVASWLGSGTNMPVTSDQLQSALGNDHVEQMGQSAGIPIDELMKMLAQALPGTVDRMSPNGVLEGPSADGDDMRSLADQAGLSDIGKR